MKPALTQLLLTYALLGITEVAACNNNTQFDCKPTGTGRRCIPLEWLCDNIGDCDNGLDEAQCSYIHDCSPGQMACHNGECIEKSWKCNGQVDCRNGHDERGCDDYTPNFKISGGSRSRPTVAASPPCTANMYKCDLGPCVLKSYLCDGEQDCPMGDDEMNCSSEASHPVASRNRHVIKCRSNHVACADNTVCIPESWVCDSELDCEDGSDEKSCPSSDEGTSKDYVDFIAEQRNPALCSAGSYRCHGMAGLCIATNKTCDGKVDCPNGDDEAGMCGECKHMNCGHSCQDTPHGPVCSCPAGLELDEDRVSCINIDQCKQHGHRCSQFCDSRNGGYSCSCANGYKLAEDRHGCQLAFGKDREGSLFISVGSEIRTTQLFETPDLHTGVESYGVYQTMYSSDSARSIAFHSHNNKLFLAVPGMHDDGHISVSFDGQLRTLRERFTGLGYIALDWISNNVFFTLGDPSSRPGIYVCTNSMFFCTRIVEGKKGTNSKSPSYKALAVNSLRGDVCWIEELATINRIKCASLDGTNVRTVVEHKIEKPFGLAFDIIRNELYFADVMNEMIEKIDMRTLVRTVVLSSGVHHPHDLIFFDGKVFWSDWSLEAVKVVDVSSEHHPSPHIVHSFQRYPFGLAINNTMYQPLYLTSSCHQDGFECAWACVSVLVDEVMTPRCMCPDEYVKNECLPSRNKTHIHKPISRLNPAYAEELCSLEHLCGSNGQCEHVYDEHQILIDVLCKCVEGFIGLHCEMADPHYPDPNGMDSETSMFGVFLFILFLMAIVAFAFYMAYHRSESFSNFTQNSVAAVQRTVPTITKGISTSIHTVRSNVGPLLPTSLSKAEISSAASAPSLAGAASPPGVRAVFDTFENPSFDGLVAPIEVSYSKKFGGSSGQN